MNIQLDIKIAVRKTHTQNEIEIFNETNWILEENKIRHMYEVLKILRPLTVRLHMNLEVADEEKAISLVNNNLKHECLTGKETLSIRETEILCMIMQGFTTQEIAEKLFISYETVKSHRKKIMKKTGSKNTAALIYHRTILDN